MVNEAGGESVDTRVLIYLFALSVDRAYSILREKNPELTGVIKKISLKPPTVCISHSSFAYKMISI